ncbi:MAG: transcription initiation factor TFIID component TAF4 family-domain-containing protein [Piptocephalis tieghemiana]|nr:MAG: transcription initiation factor TFIID component TAF4 family-domain-containing protein [Piptocephalis tieghemiana]
MTPKRGGIHPILEIIGQLQPANRTPLFGLFSRFIEKEISGEEFLTQAGSLLTPQQLSYLQNRIIQPEPSTSSSQNTPTSSSSSSSSSSSQNTPTSSSSSSSSTKIPAVVPPAPQSTLSSPTRPPPSSAKVTGKRSADAASALSPSSSSSSSSTSSSGDGPPVAKKSRSSAPSSSIYPTTSLEIVRTNPPPATNASHRAQVSKSTGSSRSGGGGGGGKQQTDVDALQDVVSASGVDLREEEESIRRDDLMGRGGDTFVDGYDRTRAQTFLDPSSLKSFVEPAARVNGLTKLDADAVSFLSLGLREHLRGLVSRMIMVSKHRQRRSDTVGELYKLDVEQDVVLQLSALRRVSRREEERRREAAKERTSASSSSSSAAANAAAKAARGKAQRLERARIKAEEQEKARLMAEEQKKWFTNRMLQKSLGGKMKDWMLQATPPAPSPRPTASSTAAASSSSSEGDGKGKASGSETSGSSPFTSSTTKPTAPSPILGGGGGKSSPMQEPLVKGNKADKGEDISSSPSSSSSPFSYGSRNGEGQVVSIHDALRVLEHEGVEGGGRRSLMRAYTKYL